MQKIMKKLQKLSKKSKKIINFGQIYEKCSQKLQTIKQINICATIHLQKHRKSFAKKSNV